MGYGAELKAIAENVTQVDGYTLLLFTTRLIVPQWK